MNVSTLEVEVTPSKPNANPPTDALQKLTGGGSVSVRIGTDSGIFGTGRVSFGRVAGASRALGAIIEHVLRDIVLGTDLQMIRGTHRAMLRETEYHGSYGLAMFGIAAVDVALWDCFGRALGVPCWHLWGGAQTKIRAYAMVGWMNYTDSELSDICKKAVDQGFGAVKIKVGFPTLGQDVARINTTRRAVGKDIDIMVDANQSLTTYEAIQRGKTFEEMGVLWWEEPLPADDIDGYRALSDALSIPVATGENLYTPAEFARFLKAGAVDIVQADLRRAGGPTSLLSIGAIADAFRAPYASHGGGPVQLNVMACLPNAYYLETGLIPEGSPLALEDGFVSVPNGPGFSWDGEVD